MNEMDSILTSIKKMLGITEEYTHFDSDIIMHINSVFMVLQQLGVGPDEGFMIDDSNAEWTSYLPNGPLLNMVKSYMYLKVRLLFDPPIGSSAMESMKNIIGEYEFRLNVEVDPGKGEIQNG